MKSEYFVHFYVTSQRSLHKGGLNTLSQCCSWSQMSWTVKELISALLPTILPCVVFKKLTEKYILTYWNKFNLKANVFFLPQKARRLSKTPPRESFMDRKACAAQTFKNLPFSRNGVFTSSSLLTCVITDEDVWSISSKNPYKCSVKFFFYLVMMILILRCLRLKMILFEKWLTFTSVD